MNETRQNELPLPYPADGQTLPLLPARMINEFQYCPRLAYLEWVQNEWEHSADTLEGRHIHRRVDQERGELPDANELPDDLQRQIRALTLSSERLGVIARIDLVETQQGQVVPIDYKRGKRPHVAKGAYDPERVQLCVQGMLLEEAGYTCTEGIIYYAGSRERVHIPFDEELKATTQNAIDGLRLMAAGGQIPPPLEDSPKCPRCSLVAICLPDEVHYLKNGDVTPRPLFVRRDEALPLYVQDNQARIKKRGDTLIIEIEGETVATARLIDVSRLVIQGNATITTPALRELLSRDIPITWMSYGGWFEGHTIGTGHKNVELRTAQYRASFDPKTCLRIAKGLIRAKILNCRTLLRRNWRNETHPPEPSLQRLKSDAERTSRAKNLEQLLGIEGTAASRYFAAFPQLLKTQDLPFSFTHRNRRPPCDPINALLSYAYTLLLKAWTVTLSAVGLDPYRGFYHQPRYGRPALALDLMEPFRPLIADSSVIQVINNGEIKNDDFINRGQAVSLTKSGRKKFIAAFERRMSQEITHPVFGYRVSYRRLLELQARLLGRFLLGEIPEYPNLITR